MISEFREIEREWESTDEVLEDAKVDLVGGS